MKEFLITLVLGIFFGIALTSWFMPKEKPDTVTITETVVDTNKFLSRFQAQFEVKLKAELAKRPYKIVKVKENLDSLIAEARNYAKDTLNAPEDAEYVYIAFADTTFKDSVSTVRVNTEVVSPIPLHKQSRINTTITAIHNCMDSVTTVYKKVEVEVRPPIYKNEWFYTALILAGVLIL